MSAKGVFPAFTERKLRMLSLGPMCRYAVDIRPMLKVLVGDKLNLPAKPLNYSTTNVYYMNKIDFPLLTPVDGEIQQGIDNVIKHFVEKGSRTIELDTMDKFSDFRHAFFLWSACIYDPTAPKPLDVLTNNNRASINPYWEALKLPFTNKSKYTAAQLLLGVLGEFKATDGSYQLEYWEEMLTKLRRDLHQLLGNDGVIICPTMPEVGKWLLLLLLLYCRHHHHIILLLSHSTNSNLSIAFPSYLPPSTQAQPNAVETDERPLLCPVERAQRCGDLCADRHRPPRHALQHPSGGRAQQRQPNHPSGGGVGEALRRLETSLPNQD